ncbi:hypothetical protein ACJX0J_006796, partial [Zea mays]
PEFGGVTLFTMCPLLRLAKECYDLPPPSAQGGWVVSRCILDDFFIALAQNLLISSIWGTEVVLKRMAPVLRIFYSFLVANISGN